MDATGGDAKFSGERGLHYLGFKICDPSALESMREIFEKIKRGIWSNEKRYPEVHRTRFNRNFKHINLWSAHIGHQEVRRLADAFEEFTNEHGDQLQNLKVKFTRLSCKQVGGRIYVAMKLHFNGQEILRELQEDVNAHFKEFQKVEFARPYDLHCSLMYLSTQLPLEIVENVVCDHSDEVRELEATLRPFILSHRREILYQYPESSSTPLDYADDVPAWVPKSLCIMWDSPGCNDEESLRILRSIAKLSSFDFEDYMLDGGLGCSWKEDYYKKERIVVTFRAVSLRDDFHRYFMRYLAESDWQLFATDVIEDHPQNFKVGVYKALPREKDSLHFYAEEACYRELPKYRSKVDLATLDLYLQQLTEPYHQHYFETRSDLDELIDLLKRGRGREYVSSIC